jgi:hypothetical protein
MMQIMMTMKKMMTMSVVLAVAALAMTSGANAAIIGSSYSSPDGPGGGNWDDAGGDVTAPGGVAWTASELFDGTIVTDDAVNVVAWWRNAGAGPTLTFDLGATYDVHTIDAWRVDKWDVFTTFEISVSTDDINYSPTTTYTPTWTSNQATIDVSAFANAQYVKMKLDSAGNGWKMLTEVAFTPEPATMSLLALGGLAMLRRRRRS